MDKLFYLIFLLSILGNLNSYYLLWQLTQNKKTGRKIFCLVGENCSLVVTSKYGTIFGIKNEILGIIYYSTLIILLIINQLGLITRFSALIALILVILAATYSLYLLYVQALKIKTFCSWCLISLVINLLILAAYLALI